MPESFIIGKQCITICARCESSGKGSAVHCLTPGSNTFLFSRWMSEPQAQDALRRALNNGYIVTGMSASEMAELLDQLVYDRKIAVSISPAPKKKKRSGGFGASGKRAILKGPAEYDRWADGARPLGKGCWEQK